ncbi:hypothetical protein [Janibacter hoylei]|uniref:hypothetical protein n=1 Tax=Janibacter hoylei TaxID=364298 RepID=UPI0027BA6447|nr:hypothetical protein [Janibacter hoylei]
MLFAALWLSELIPAAVSGEVLASVVDAGLWVNPVHVIDLALLLPAMVLAGVLALRRRPLGLLLVGPLLVFSALMGMSIVAAMVLMTLEGFEATLPPLVMVSVVVLVSLYAGVRHLRRCAARSEPAVARPSNGGVPLTTQDP